MVAIPKKQGTIHSIDAKQFGGKPRSYLGMSSIGDSCWRKLWYGLHWVNPQPHNARSERIFNIGHLFEAIAIADLKEADCFVFRVDEEGNQIELTGDKNEEQEELIGFAGHSKGHPDGRIIGLLEYPDQQLLLELKTMKDDKFNNFKKNGIQKSHNIYYCQAQKYMKKMNLSMCFFLAINKDTCEYWWEFVPLNHSEADELDRKEKVIIISDEPPERAYASNHYLCGFCDYYSQCHAKQEPQKNCRTCEHCDLEDGGKWSCAIQDEKELSVEEQREGCGEWEIGWGLNK